MKQRRKRDIGAGEKSARARSQAAAGTGEKPARARVIAVAGAGGKSTFIDREAEAAVSEGKKVAVTTTTHIYDPRVRTGETDTWTGDERQPVCTADGADFFGTAAGDGKLGPVSAACFRDICARYDVVFVEADGSHFMPAKIPVGREPVLPENTDRLVVVMGKHAVGRPPEAVLQHYGEVRPEWISAGSPLTEGDLRLIAQNCYIKPVRRTHPTLPVSVYLSDLYRSGHADGVKDITLVLMASGFGRRYSRTKNKLLEPFHGESVWARTLQNIRRAADILKKETSIRPHIKLVTRLTEIMERAAGLRMDDLQILYNSMAEEGITSSIRTGTRAALLDGSQGVLFFAADMPYLGGNDIARFIRDFVSSGKTYGCMACRDTAAKQDAGATGVFTSVPGAFRLTDPLVRDRLLALKGDRGAMRIIRRYPWDTYYYYIEKRYLEDIDLPSDLD